MNEHHRSSEADTPDLAVKRGVFLRTFTCFVGKVEFWSEDVRRLFIALGKIAPSLEGASLKWVRALRALELSESQRTDSSVVTRVVTRSHRVARRIGASIACTLILGSGVGGLELAVKRGLLPGPEAGRLQALAYESTKADVESSQAEREASQAESEAARLSPGPEAEAKANLFLAQADLEAKAAAAEESDADARATDVSRLSGQLEGLKDEMERLTDMAKTASGPDAAVHLRDVAQMRRDIQGLLRDMGPLRSLEKVHRDEAGRHNALANALRAQADQIESPEARTAQSNAQRLRTRADALKSQADQLRQTAPH